MAISRCPPQLFRTKWSPIVKNWGKIAISNLSAQPFFTKWGSIVTKSLSAFCGVPQGAMWAPARKPAGTAPMTDVQVLSMFSSCPAQPSRTKWRSIIKDWSKIAISSCPAQPFRTKWASIVKHCGKTAISKWSRKPFRTKWGSIVKNWGKNCDFQGVRATLSYEMRFDRWKQR